MQTEGSWKGWRENGVVRGALLCAVCMTCLGLLISAPAPQPYSIPEMLPAPNQTDPRLPLQGTQYDAAYFAALDARTRDAHMLIYNRVPKCGSSATRAILKRLARSTHRFKFSSSRIYHTEHMTSNQTRQLVAKLRKLKKQWIYERHLHFVDTSKYGLTMPLYINLVRKPVDRFVSQYYFYRFEHRKPMSPERRNRTFDECVLKNFDECSTEDAFVIIPFFCGQDSMCLKPSQAALARAKNNVDKFYGVIGLTEDLNPTYALMEKTIPHFFANMSHTATGSLRALKSRFKTHKKPKPSVKALRIMKSRLELENEFYHYVRNRYVQFLKHYEVKSPLLD